MQTQQLFTFFERYWQGDDLTRLQRQDTKYERFFQ
jgi:hypothetical protein